LPARRHCEPELLLSLAHLQLHLAELNAPAYQRGAARAVDENEALVACTFAVLRDPFTKHALALLDANNQDAAGTGAGIVPELDKPQLALLFDFLKAGKTPDLRTHAAGVLGAFFFVFLCGALVS
jgi:hypothetical protein